jgi:hypothetical protein
MGIDAARSFGLGWGKNASDVDFKKHTLKVLGERGMEGRKRRWEEEEGNGRNEQGLHEWPENSLSDGYPRRVSISADRCVAPASQRTQGDITTR